MHFEPEALYHIYNRSNEIIFHSRDNYLYFLSKIRQQISPFSNILAWVLMPNHFHFLIQATNESCKNITEAHRPQIQVLSKNFGTVLSSYTQAINRRQNRRGKLFAHNTKAKNLNDIAFENALSSWNHLAHKQPDYATTCFLYIHQNPVMAGLVPKLEDWEFSSFRDYAGFRNGKLVDYKLTKEIIELDFEDFHKQSQILVEGDILKKLF